MGKPLPFLSSSPFVLIVSAMGIAVGTGYQLLSTFCFAPQAPGDAGRGHAQRAHPRADDLLGGWSPASRREPEPHLLCDGVVCRAKVIELVSERTSDVVAYRLTLDVLPSMSGQPVAAVIVLCGLSAECISEFTKPGGYDLRRDLTACSSARIQLHSANLNRIGPGVAQIRPDFVERLTINAV